MTSITIELSEEKYTRLIALATRYGLSLHELLDMGIEDMLTRLDDEFDTAANYILDENKELYRRLA